MPGGMRFNGGRVAAAVIAAEAVPVLALVVVVLVYGLVKPPGALPPGRFALAAGMWVGPIGGFLATLLFARWAARGSLQRPMIHGGAVGLGTALLDLGIAILAGGGGPVDPVLLFSNGGRLAAGVLGGWLAARARTPKRPGNREDKSGGRT